MDQQSFNQIPSQATTEESINNKLGECLSNFQNPTDQSGYANETTLTTVESQPVELPIYENNIDQTNNDQEMLDNETKQCESYTNNQEKVLNLASSIINLFLCIVLRY